MATPPAPAAALLPHVDELVLEYLLFRGFTRSFQALAAERKRDRAKGFDVEQITAQLLAFVQNYQLESMLDTWKFLDARFFSRLDASYTATIRQLEDAWLRLYLVHAIKSGHRDKAIEFFRLLADKLNAKGGASGGDSWHRWFIIPYVQHPESDAFFRPFFEKQWLDTFLTSFRNFLSLIFRNMALPKLLALQVGRLEEPALKLRLKTSQSECSRLRLQNAKSAERIHRLEDAGQKMLHMVETLVQHSFAEHFNDSEAGFGWSEKIPEDGDVAPEVIKALASLSSQLRELRDVLGLISSDINATQSDQELVTAMLEPLAVKTNTSPSSIHGGLTKQDTAVTVVGLLSPPSSSSLQSAESVSSPSHSNPRPIRAVLVDETQLAFDPVEDIANGICKYAHNGRRLLVGRIGERTIQVLDVDGDGHTVEREQIHTESSVVGVDWVAHSECLVYALEDGTINVWDTETMARTFIISYNADERRPSRLACARSRSIGAVALVTNPGDFTQTSTRIQFFAFEDQAMRVLSSVDMDGTADLVSLRWASDGSTLAVTDDDGCVSLVGLSEKKLLGSWHLGTRDLPISDVTFGSDDQSLIVVGASARFAMEWSLPELVAAGSSEPPQHRAVYRLPDEMTEADSNLKRMVEAQATRSRFVISSNASSACWTVYTRGHADAVIATPIITNGRVDALAWHPVDNILAVTTAAGTLSVWKFSEEVSGA